MVVLVDTNIILDFLTTREPFYQAASLVMEKCVTGELEGCVAFHTIPNLWYILRKVPEEQRRTWIEKICDCFGEIIKKMTCTAMIKCPTRYVMVPRIWI